MPQYLVKRGKILHKDVVYYPGTVIELPEDVARGLQQDMVEPIQVSPVKVTGAPVKLEPEPQVEQEEKKEEEKAAFGPRSRRRRE